MHACTVSNMNSDYSLVSCTNTGRFPCVSQFIAGGVQYIAVVTGEELERVFLVSSGLSLTAFPFADFALISSFVVSLRCEYQCRLSPVSSHRELQTQRRVLGPMT